MFSHNRFVITIARRDEAIPGIKHYQPRGHYREIERRKSDNGFLCAEYFQHLG